MTRIEAPAQRSAVSRALHALQSLSAKAEASAVAALLSVVVLGWAFESPGTNSILQWFGATANTITLVMVFVLQHTQARQQEAVQRKLDEVLLSLPNADDRLIKLESASDSEFVEVDQRHSAARDVALED